MATYYVRADGTAANKAAATNPALASGAMTMTVFNASTFSVGDIVMFCDAGGEYGAALVVPSSGGSGDPIIYQSYPGDGPAVYSGSAGLAVGARSNIIVDGFILGVTGELNHHKALGMSGAHANVILRNLTMDVSRSTAATRYLITNTGTPNGLTIENISQVGVSTGNAIYFSGASGVDVELSNIDLSGNSASGIVLWNVENLTLDDITISGGTTSIHLLGASGLLQATDLTLTGGSLFGLSIKDSTLDAESSATGLSITDKASHGVLLENVDNLYLAGEVANSGGNGVLVMTGSTNIDHGDVIVSESINGSLWVNDTCSGITYDGSISEDNDMDGFGLDSSASDIQYTNCISRRNGTPSSTHAGDGFTTHTHATNVRYHGCLAYENTCTGWGLSGDGDGEVYGCTSIGNGTGIDQVRAELYYAVETGGEYVLRNNIFMNLDSYPVTLIGSAAVLPDVDYNCYISNISEPFIIQGDSMGFTEWVAAIGGDTHSYFILKNGTNYEVYHGAAPATLIRTLTYCPVRTDGKLVNASDNPLINGGAWITGVNDTGDPDIWGNYIHRLPNIGADQGAGSPGSIQIMFRGI